MTDDIRHWHMTPDNNVQLLDWLPTSMSLGWLDGFFWWLNGVVVRTSDLRLSVAGLIPDHDTAWLSLR